MTQTMQESPRTTRPGHPPPATVTDLMRPPLTTVERTAHVAAAAYLMKAFTSATTSKRARGEGDSQAQPTAVVCRCSRDIHGMILGAWWAGLLKAQVATLPGQGVTYVLENHCGGNVTVG
jgi:hypothetical protein